MAIKSRVALKTERNTLFADNTTGDITPQDARDMLDDLIDSSVNSLDDGTVITFSVTVPNSALTTLFSSPYEIIPSPGAGKLIIPIGCWMFKLIYGSAALATNVNYNYQYESGIPLMSSGSALNYGADSYNLDQMTKYQGAVAADIEDNSIQLVGVTGDATAGTGCTVLISGQYKVI